MDKGKKQMLAVSGVFFLGAFLLLCALVMLNACTWVSHTKGGTTVKGLSMDSPAEFVAITTQADTEGSEIESINYVREMCAHFPKKGCQALALSTYSGYGYGYGYGMPGIPFGATWVSNRSYVNSQGGNNAGLKQEVEALKKKQHRDDAIHDRIKQRFQRR
ncbi:hypothetical protein ACFL29_01775 [Patescibacteria group bacterium]